VTRSALCGALFLAAACGRAHTTVELAPTPGGPRYARVLVSMALPVGTVRDSLESTFAGSPIESGSQLIPSKAMRGHPSPTSDSAMRKALLAEGIDGFLTVQLVGAELGVRDQRPSLHCYSGTPMQCVNTPPPGRARWETQVGRVVFLVSLWDATTLRAVWVGRTEVHMNGSAKSPFVPALARNVLQSLIRADLLLPPPSNR
jgi:hypothetical protein